ncbi:MAG: PIG-L family deacetylase [Bdellovibrionaceae bacterium]|nr:PIG-L family deacetylase [Pseudobdellovibrionaceae bacterium]
MKKTILAIGAHPDDIEIGCGGTLSILKDKGHKLIHLIMTSGEEGDLQSHKKQIAEKREFEATQSSKLLKVSQIIFPDSRIKRVNRKHFHFIKLNKVFLSKNIVFENQEA